MNIEKMREEFKAWAMKDFGLRDGHFVEEDGEFANYPTHCYWLVWQASRESLLIELPDDGIEDCRKEWPERGEKYGYDTFDTGYLYACKKHEEAIEAAGLKVKP